MTAYQVLPLLQGLFSSVLFFLVARHDQRSTLNRLFLLFLGGMAFWGFSIGGMRLSPNLQQALWWERASLSLIGLTGVAFYLFVRRYIGLRWSWGGYLAVGFLVVTVVVAPTGLLVEGMAQDVYG
ncbi:MAG: histidine kinase N-terminal 7TM domain-containing protein, partial [Dehalococcoidia bacterium]|nr:histidine kinase N-terminal 7TM domain-containing protein [Dehalococcoidia bacterium]